MTDRRRWVCQEIARDAEADVTRFELAPFTGKTVAEYMGCQAAAIAALAKLVESLLPPGLPGHNQYCQDDWEMYHGDGPRRMGPKGDGCVCVLAPDVDES